MRFPAAVLTFLAFWAVAASAQTVSLVSTGHKGAVSDLAFDQGRRLLFSAGEDGTVRIWGVDDGSLRGILAVSRRRITRIAVHPALPLLAVVESTGSFSARLSVWDWSRQEAVFHEPLEDDPLFLRWSSSGSVLMFGKSAWDSLRMLRTGDWTPVPTAVESEGIVGFAELSRNENTILTYSPVGRIAYLGMADGIVLKEAKAVAYQSQLRITADRRYLVGATDRELLVTDLDSGAVSARADLPRIRRLDVSPQGDQVLCVAASQARSRLTLWDRTDYGLFRGYLPAAVDSADIGAACFGGGGLYAAGSDGMIWSVSADGRAEALARDECPDFTGIDLRAGSLALADAGRILVFESDSLGTALADALPSSIALRSFPNPFSTATDLLFLGDGRLLLWRKGTDCGAMEILDPATGLREPGPSFEGQVVSVRRSGSRLLTVEKGGTVRLTDLDSRATVFRTWDPGMNAAVFLSGDVFVGGRSSSAQGSLVRIDARTGETVSIPDRYRFVFAVTAFSREVFALGVDLEGGTGLSARRGGQLEEETLINRYPGEDVGAAMAAAPDGTLYFLLGTERIKAWDGLQVTELAGSGRIPRSLIASSRLIIAVNTDSTLSFWDASSGAVLCNATVFRDGEWVVTLASGNYLSSRTEEPRVRTLVDGDPLPDSAPYRIVLPGPAEDPVGLPPAW